MKQILIYGAYGYTGQLITKEAVANGLRPVLSGRNGEKLKDLASDMQLDYEILDLEDAGKLENALKDFDLVIHCAGPFSATAEPMVDACLASNTHYIDITGEYKVFQSIAEKDEKARKAGIMLLPGAGFDVVPSDCLAKKLYNSLPSGNNLELAFAGLGGGVSRGTAKTMLEGAADGQKYRKDGRLHTEKIGKRVKTINYGHDKILSVAISWGDIVTASYSTGISNIEVFTGTTPKQLKQMRILGKIHWLMKFKPIKNYLKGKIEKQKAGPSQERREKSKTYLYGKVWNNEKNVEQRLITPNGYTLTAKSAVLISNKILSGDFKPGFQTPATAYGENLILEIEGCEFL